LIEPFSEKYLNKLMKKLIGYNDIEDALKRLDRLTQEEALMASAQLMETADKIADNVLDVDHRVAGVDDRVAGVGDQVAGVDDRVAGVDERVAGVDERVAGVDKRVAGVDERVAGVDEHVAGVGDRVAGVDDRMAGLDDRVKVVNDNVKGVDDKLVAVIDGAQYIFNQSSKIVQLLTRLDGKEAREVIQQTADDVDQVKRSWFPNRTHAGHTDSIILTGNQLRQDFLRWLSPQDPSTNHNIAINAHHKGTATWFFEGRTYEEWKSTGSESLLWIHGKRAPLSHSAT
jgi:archaellum component FlaC